MHDHISFIYLSVMGQLAPWAESINFRAIAQLTQYSTYNVSGIDKLMITCEFDFAVMHLSQ